LDAEIADELLLFILN